MTLYKSSNGEIGTKAYWESELDLFWMHLGSLSDPSRNPVPRPADAWERMVRVLKLEIVTEV